jgi:hypothetical protein
VTPLGHAVEAPTAGLDGALSAIVDLWIHIGFTSVNDQPVKNPTDDDLARLEGLLIEAGKHLRVAVKARAKE